MSEAKRFSLVKPTVQTPFHIDFDWWKNHDNNWRVYLLSYVCAEHQAVFQNTSESTSVDWVDPKTAEVHTVDGLQHVLINHCARQSGFVTGHTTLVDAVFRVLLANGNEPLSPEELAHEVNKSADTILRTLSGSQVYKGIRPISQTS